MKNSLFSYFLILVGSTLALACGQTSGPVIINKNAAEDIALVRGYQDAIFSGDFDRAAD